MKRNFCLFIATCLLMICTPALGQDILQPLSGIDQRAANQNFQAALEYNTSGTPLTWHNPDAAISGTTVPIRTWQADNGQACREFQQSVIIAGREQQAYGTACRQPDGQWRIVNPRTLQPPSQVVRPLQPAPPVYRYSRVQPDYWYYPASLVIGFGLVRYFDYDDHRHYRHYPHYRDNRHHWPNQRHFDRGWDHRRHRR